MSQPAWMYEEGGSTQSAQDNAAPAFMPTSFAPPPQQQSQPVGGGGGGGFQPVGGASSAEEGFDRTTSNDGQIVYRFGDPADDLPLLEELGIFPSHIKAKALTVMHPMKAMSAEVVEDTDLAGPLVFALLLGFLLSLQGKMQFGAIYTLSLLGIMVGKALLSLMAEQPVKTQFVISTLGYCLIPNLTLAVVQTFKYWIAGNGGVMVPVSLAVIGWSGWCATQMFVAALMMHEQKYLLLYPCILFYAAFAALTIF